MCKHREFRHRLAGLIAAALCAGAWTSAIAETQEDRIKALEQHLARSVQVIEKLAARVAELEQAMGRTTASAAAPTAAASAPVSPQQPDRAAGGLQHSVSQMAGSLDRAGVETASVLHGFVDVGAGWSTAQDPRRQRGFNAGSINFYLTPQIGRVRSLVELVIEANPEGTVLDLERLQLGYTVSDSLTLWAGRFHTPFGLWNTAFHHGVQLQTSISRPSVIEFEDRGGLLPIHAVGLWATGKVRVGAGRLNYDAYLSNGSSIRGRNIEPDLFTDRNANKMLGLNLGYQFGHNPGDLILGVHAFDTAVRAYSAADELRGTTRLRAVGSYVGYDLHDWELIGEYYAIRGREEAGGPTRRSSAAFVQLGRSFGAWTPYMRLERTALDAQDSYFRSIQWARPFRQAVAGVNYALDATSSLKLELRRTRDSAYNLLDDNGAPLQLDAARYSRMQLQYSLAF